MAREQSPEMDDELFNEVYGKAYSGPVTSAANESKSKESGDKRPYTEKKSDDEEEPYDPNSVPTDFTSREAKVWVAKAKATERNWKMRKEEEMICKICGESGHFTQGCPKTLGGNRKSADFFERVPARDKQVRDIFSSKVIAQIEKDVGCKIKMDEKFMFVHGKDRLILAKGVDAVHKLIQEKKGKNSSPSSPIRARSRSPDIGAKVSQFSRSNPQRSRSPSIARSQNRDFSERFAQDHIREDSHKFSRGSPQAHYNLGAKERPAYPRSPRRPSLVNDSVRSYEEESRYATNHKTSNWNAENHGTTNVQSDRKSGMPTYPQSLEDMESEFMREAVELGKARDQEEDEENYKHREKIRELRENYMKRISMLRNVHAKQWEEFCQLRIQQQQQGHQPTYNTPPYSEYDQRMVRDTSGPPAMDRRNSRYQYPGDNYLAPMPQNSYNEYRHQRSGDFDKAYGRY